MRVPDRLLVGRSSSGSKSDELRAGPDAELAVDVREMALDRSDAHEQRVGDLPIGATGRGEPGHPLLGFRQLTERRLDVHRSGRAPPGPARPRAARRGPRRSRRRLLERFPGRLLLLGPATDAPRTMSVCRSSNGIGRRSCTCERLEPAPRTPPSRSPRAAASSARQRAATARAHGRSSVRPRSSSHDDDLGRGRVRTELDRAPRRDRRRTGTSRAHRTPRRGGGCHARSRCSCAADGFAQRQLERAERGERHERRVDRAAPHGRIQRLLRRATGIVDLPQTGLDERQRSRADRRAPGSRRPRS